MRIQVLLGAVVLLAGCGAGGTNSTTTNPVPGTQPTCPSFYPVDIFLNMNGAPSGTAVTDANLLASTDAPASFGGWASASPFQKFELSFVTLPATVPVNGGPTRACRFSTQSLGDDATQNFNTSSLNIPFKSQLVLGGWISNFPPDQDGKGGYFDVASASGVKGYAATIQIVSGTDEPACTGYGIEIESSGTATRHSACLGTIVPGGTYFVQMHVNFASTGSCSGALAAPCAEMNVYTTSGATFTQVGSTVSVTLSDADSISLVRLGNNENGQFPGTIYFQNWMMDYTNSKFPNLPH
jgi:hypothetical protein